MFFPQRSGPGWRKPFRAASLGGGVKCWASFIFATPVEPARFDSRGVRRWADPPRILRLLSASMARASYRGTQRSAPVILSFRVAWAWPACFEYALVAEVHRRLGGGELPRIWDSKRRMPFGGVQGRSPCLNHAGEVGRLRNLHAGKVGSWPKGQRRGGGGQTTGRRRLLLDIVSAVGGVIDGVGEARFEQGAEQCEEGEGAAGILVFEAFEGLGGEE